MPRKSSVSGDVLHVFVPGERPPPPEDLTPEQGAEWIKIVDRMPPSWFTGEMWPLLVELILFPLSALAMAAAMMPWIVGYVCVVIMQQCMDTAASPDCKPEPYPYDGNVVSFKMPR